MPKETYFNLTEEKKKKILDAAKEEFINFSLYKSRVSNIIENAGIPRGSFYQYFIDLEDLYFYVMDLYIDGIYEEGMRFAEKTDDLFEFSEMSFEYDYDAFINDSRHKLIGNMLQSMSDNPGYIEAFNKKRVVYVKALLNNLDTSNIVYKDEDELIRIYFMIQTMKRNAVHKGFIEKFTKAEAIEDFKWAMNIIKNGIKVKQ